MGRTIVVSDAHGRLLPLEAALAHTLFDADTDHLVTAGDLIDVGNEDVIAKAESLGATVLVGNHEVAAALGLRIFPQNESSLERSDEFAEKILAGRWTLAASVDGWLVTHAGVSVALSDLFASNPEDPTAIAQILNARFAEEFAQAMERRPLAWEDLDRYRIIGGQSGPLWFRPLSTSLLPPGLRQIVGHTPPETLAADARRILEASGWLLVDSGGHGTTAAEGTFRYGLIEDGLATVVEG